MVSYTHPSQIRIDVDTLLVKQRASALAQNNLSIFIELNKYLRHTNTIVEHLWQSKRFEFNLETIRNDIYKSEHKNRSEKVSTLVQKMRAPLSKLPFREGFVPASLVRMRDSFRDWTYVGIAHFKSPQRFYYCSEPYDSQPFIMDVGPIPCMNHSCDLLYKEWKGSDSCGYLPYKSPSDLESELNEDFSQPLEFMDRITHKTKDEEVYVLAGFAGKFQNVPTFEVPLSLYNSF